MNQKIVESLKAGAKELRERKETDSADRQGAYFIDRAIEHLEGSDAKRAARPTDAPSTAAPSSGQPSTE